MEVEKKESEVTLRDIILTLRDYRNHLFDRWRVLLFAVILGGTLGFVYSVYDEPLYNAELTFVLEEEGSSGGLNVLAGQFGLDMGAGGTGAFSGDNLLTLMKSKALVQRTLLRKVKYNKRNITLAELYLEVHVGDTWAKNILSTRPKLDQLTIDSISPNEQNALNAIYENVVKNDLLLDKLDKKTTLMVIKVRTPSELFSLSLCKILAEEVSRFYVQTKTKKSAYNVVVLQRQVDSVKRELNSAISGYARSTDASTNANPARQVLQIPSQRRQFDVETNKAILEELVKNLEISKISLRKETPLIQIIDNPSIPLSLEKVGTSKSIFFGVSCAFIFTSSILLLSRIFRNLMKY